MWLGSLSVPALCLVASFHVPRAAPDQPRVQVPVRPRPMPWPGHQYTLEGWRVGLQSRTEVFGAISPAGAVYGLVAESG